MEEDARRIRRTLDIIEEAPQMTSGLFGLKSSMENQKRDIEEKLEKINQFMINAQGIYSGNQNMEALIRQGIGVMQAFSITYSILGEINKEQGKLLLENAEKTFGYSAKTADDLIKCADDIDQAIRVGEKGAKFAHFSKYNMTVIGSVLDYEVLRAGGAEVGETVVKTTVHAATGYVVGTAVTAIVMSPTAIPVGIVVGAGIAVTMVLNSYFDSEYDNIGFLKDIDGFIDKTIDGVGKGLKDFFSGVVEIFE